MLKNNFIIAHNFIIAYLLKKDMMLIVFVSVKDPYIQIRFFNYTLISLLVRIVEDKEDVLLVKIN